MMILTENYEIQKRTSPQFSVNASLTQLTKKGVVDFKLHENNIWNGKELRIPAYGIYKISWGFYQNSLDTFYNDEATEVSLIINDKKTQDSAIITRETPSLYAQKSVHTTETILLKEKDTLTLNVKTSGNQDLKISDIYFKVIKI